MMVEYRQVLLYVCRRSVRCWLTRRLLERRGYYIKVIDATDDARLCSWLAGFTGRESLPYVFVDDRPVGGFREVRALDGSGILEQLIRGEV